MNQIGPSGGVAISSNYDVEAIGDTPAPGAAAASGAVQQKGRELQRASEEILKKFKRYLREI